MTRQPSKRKPTRTRRAATKRPAPSFRITTIRDDTNPAITYGRKRDGSFVVKLGGKDAGDLRPSETFKGHYYASIYNETGYMLGREDLRLPMELPALKQRIATFLS